MKTLLQNWGDYADMSQAVIVYLTLCSDVLLICWFGTQLTYHVRENGLLLLLLTLFKNLRSLCGSSHKSISTIFSLPH